MSHYEWWDELAPELDADQRRRIVRALNLAANRWVQDNPGRYLDLIQTAAQEAHWLTPLPPTAGI